MQGKNGDKTIDGDNATVTSTNAIHIGSSLTGGGWSSNNNDSGNEHNNSEVYLQFSGNYSTSRGRSSYDAEHQSNVNDIAAKQPADLHKTMLTLNKLAKSRVIQMGF